MTSSVTESMTLGQNSGPERPRSLTALNGRVCVVTGASSGIGAAVAAALATAGARVVGLARRFSPPVSVSAGLPVIGELPAPGQVASVHLDVTDLAAVDARFGELVALAEPVGGLEAVVNAAGLGYFAPSLTTDIAELRALLEVHVVGAFACSQAALAAMKPHGRGCIIAIGSVAAVRTIADCAAYTAAKAGQLGFTRVMAQEARSYGVRVTTLVTGAVDTPLWNQRPEFDRDKMLSADSVAAVVRDIIARPDMVIDELIVTPPAGIL